MVLKGCWYEEGCLYWECVLALGSVGFGSISWYWDVVGIAGVGIEGCVLELRAHAHMVPVLGVFRHTVLILGEYMYVNIRSMCACADTGDVCDGVVWVRVSNEQAH